MPFSRSLLRKQVVLSSFLRTATLHDSLARFFPGPGRRSLLATRNNPPVSNAAEVF